MIKVTPGKTSLKGQYNSQDPQGEWREVEKKTGCSTRERKRKHCKFVKTQEV